MKNNRFNATLVAVFLLLASAYLPGAKAIAGNKELESLNLSPEPNPHDPEESTSQPSGSGIDCRQTSEWVNLAPEIWVKIMHYLNSKDFNRFAKTCRLFNTLLSTHYEGISQDRGSTIYLSLNSKLTPEDKTLIAAFRALYGDVKHIKIHPLEFNNEKLSSLKLCAKGIRWLDLRACQDLNDESLAHIKDLPLTHLYLFRCDISDQGLVHLKDLPLTYLDLSGCSKISNHGLAHLNNIPLTFLRLAACSNISHQGLACIKDPRLAYLDLSGCSKISNLSLDYIKDFPLASLNLTRCNISDEAMAQLKHTLPHCKIYH